MRTSSASDDTTFPLSAFAPSRKMGFSGCVVLTTYSPSPLAYAENRDRINVTQSSG